uniref:Uncharacterized protein n=1 Tax=Rhizophora mucronata TaxID=61149 RepID=A0A2P2N5J9_RHIMU
MKWSMPSSTFLFHIIPIVLPLSVWRNFLRKLLFVESISYKHTLHSINLAMYSWVPCCKIC